MPNKSADLNLAAYLDFFASRTSIEVIYSLYVFSATHLYEHLNDTAEGYGDILLNRIKKDLEEQLNGYFEDIPTKKIEVTAGQMVSELLRKGYHDKFDLIALGEHSDSDKTLAKKLIRHVPVNCLFVPDKAAKRLSHILVPVDLSEHSAKLLDVAIQLKQNWGDDVKVSCYHAFEMPNISAYELMKTEYKFHEMIKENHHQALHRFVDKHAGANRSEIEVVVQEISNRPDRAILEYMNKKEVDFVIMGTKGHSVIEAWLGSTVERVISKNDNVPMLIIK